MTCNKFSKDLTSILTYNCKPRVASVIRQEFVVILKYNKNKQTRVTNVMLVEDNNHTRLADEKLHSTLV